ncbi:hemin uptake protein HemP [Polynucleobacter antarcticus]|uniref:hemin uptake protein HemP n=1 Tax=Polynucleobacter antarcticus TaxID=1743162 RepID=UPI001C2D6A17|nr:hemin uptake protein HemP [Polynucleobacter antarcticus]
MNIHTEAVNQKLCPSQAHWGKVITSEVLLGGNLSIIILHDGHQYRLSITKLKKLILTK